MIAYKFISDYRRTEDSARLSEYSALFSCQISKTQNGRPADLNLQFRTAIVDELLHDFSVADIGLIRALFKEEMKCEKATAIHDNLYQLCFYLYSLGELEDVFALYDAKFNASNMDVGLMLDRYLITVGHEVDEVISYVTCAFDKNDAIIARYPTLLDELNDLKEYPDYESVVDYSRFLRGYFLGHR